MFFTNKKDKIFNWSPQAYNFEQSATTPMIDVGDNDGVLIENGLTNPLIVLVRPPKKLPIPVPPIEIDGNWGKLISGKFISGILNGNDKFGNLIPSKNPPIDENDGKSIEGPFNPFKENLLTEKGEKKYFQYLLFVHYKNFHQFYLIFQYKLLNFQ